MVDKKILRIEALISAISDKQIAIEGVADSDLGYRMAGYKDGASAQRKLLAKNLPGWLSTLRLTGTETTGDTGILRHDVVGDVAGGQMTLAQLNSYVSNGPVGGVTSLADNAGDLLTGDLKLYEGANIIIDQAMDESGFVINALVGNVSYIADSITLTTGTLVGGDVDSTHVPVDDDDYEISEVTGVPGFDVSLDFSSVDVFDKISTRIKYDGSGAHTPTVQLWNYDTSAWVDFGEFTLGITWQVLEFLVVDSSDYVSSGASRVRFYHDESGLANHDFHIDYVALVRTGGAALAIPANEIAYGTGAGVSSSPYNTFNPTTFSHRMGPNSSATGDGSRAAGDDASATGNYSDAQGILVVASGGASSARGASVSATHDFSDVRGNGSSSVWKGARHFSGDRIDGEFSSQCMDGMTLVLQTTDDTVTHLLFDVGDSDSPLFCPDGVIQYYSVRLTGGTVSGTLDGFLVQDFHVAVMRNDPDSNAYIVPGTLSAVEERGDGDLMVGAAYGEAAFAASGNNVDIDVEGHATTIINWTAHVSRGVQVASTFYVGGTSG